MNELVEALHRAIDVIMQLQDENQELKLRIARLEEENEDLRYALTEGGER